MPQQVLLIEPQNELKFKGLFEQGYTTYMRLTNPTTDTVLFKIKTTAPKKYCVRPNSGVLEPNSKVDIAITPQPVYVEANEKHKHKFMVQSIIAPEGKTNIDQVWKETNPEQLMDYKLKCVFETPRGTNLNDAGDNAGQSEANKKRVAVADEKPAATSKEDVEVVKKFDAAVTTTTPVKAASSPKTETTAVGDSEVQKAASEVIQLREEESKLRIENLQLKEELMRLRQARDGRVQSQHMYAPEAASVVGGLMPWIAIAMAVLGVVIGKFFM